MNARDCTQFLNAVQYGVLAQSNYSRFYRTSVHAPWRLYSLTYLIAESCSSGDLSKWEINSSDDSDTPGRALAHMLLKKLAWMIEKFAPETGQERS
jgi:hypothetical protein